MTGARGGRQDPKNNDSTDRSHKRSGTLPTSFSLSNRGKELLDRIAQYHGLSRTAAVEMIARHYARELDLHLKSKPDGE